MLDVQHPRMRLISVGGGHPATLTRMRLISVGGGFPAALSKKNIMVYVDFVISARARDDGLDVL